MFIRTRLFTTLLVEIGSFKNQNRFSCVVQQSAAVPQQPCPPDGSDCDGCWPAAVQQHLRIRGPRSFHPIVLDLGNNTNCHGRQRYCLHLQSVFAVIVIVTDPQVVVPAAWCKSLGRQSCCTQGVHRHLAALEEVRQDVRRRWRKHSRAGRSASHRPLAAPRQLAGGLARLKYKGARTCAAAHFMASPSGIAGATALTRHRGESTAKCSMWIPQSGKHLGAG